MHPALLDSVSVPFGKWRQICPWSLKRLSKTLRSAVEKAINKRELTRKPVLDRLGELLWWWALTWSTTRVHSGKLCTRKRSGDTMHTAAQNSKQWWRQGWAAWETKRNQHIEKWKQKRTVTNITGFKGTGTSRRWWPGLSGSKQWINYRRQMSYQGPQLSVVIQQKTSGTVLILYYMYTT